MRLALRSSYWVNMKADLQYFLNDCSSCVANQAQNKKLEKLPEVEVREPFEQLTMDIGKTPANEHILVISDRYTGYVWAAKTGDTGTGTSKQCIDILKTHIGAGLLTTKTIKSDEGSQLISAEMTEFLKNKGIDSITSSAYNPSGNLLAENSIRRVKRAIGRERMEDAWEDIQALNYSSPYSNKIRSPFEAMYKFYPKQIGIPKPDFLRTENQTQRINHKAEKNVDKYGCDQWEERSFDRHKVTMKERLIDDFWEEKIHDKSINSMLEPGDNIYYRDPTIKGFGRWRPGLILDRKGEQENNGRLIKLKGYDILDTVTGKHTTRTREDIRVRKKSFLEDKVYKQYVEFLNKLQRASNENDNSDAEYKKPEFKESHGRKQTPTQTPMPTRTPTITPTNPEEKENTEDQGIKTEPTTTTPEVPTIPAEEPLPTPTEQPAERKTSREEKNLKSDLGNYWRCTDHDPHYDGSLGRQLRARVTELKIEDELKEELEAYWILEDEEDKDFIGWKKLLESIK